MPELPEVETIVRGLKKVILNRKIEDVWTDFKKMIKKPADFEEFKKEIIGKKIKKVWRRGKNIIINLNQKLKNKSEKSILLIHQKLTGHFLIGNWKFEDGNWIPLTNGPLKEPVNRFLHLIFWLDNSKMLALSDLRKFAKIELLSKEELEKKLKELGPEPLEKNFTFEKFKQILPKKGKIKKILMDQKKIAGIGNIYSDEILWRAKIHPLKDVSKLNEKELKLIFKTIKEVLKRAIELGGESISDFRNIFGKKGFFDKERKVYQREGEKCNRCGAFIKRIKISERSAYFCPFCQK